MDMYKKPEPLLPTMSSHIRSRMPRPTLGPADRRIFPDEGTLPTNSVSQRTKDEAEEVKEEDKEEVKEEDVEDSEMEDSDMEDSDMKDSDVEDSEVKRTDG